MTIWGHGESLEKMRREIRKFRREEGMMNEKMT